MTRCGDCKRYDECSPWVEPDETFPEVDGCPAFVANEDRCVCCGEIIPEGRMVCPNCLVTVKENEDGNKT